MIIIILFKLELRINYMLISAIIEVVSLESIYLLQSNNKIGIFQMKTIKN